MSTTGIPRKAPMAYPNADGRPPLVGLKQLSRFWLLSEVRLKEILAEGRPVFTLPKDAGGRRYAAVPRAHADEVYGSEIFWRRERDNQLEHARSGQFTGRGSFKVRPIDWLEGIQDSTIAAVEQAAEKFDVCTAAVWNKYKSELAENQDPAWVEKLLRVRLDSYLFGRTRNKPRRR
jgi:hypothetical protein